MGDGLRSRWGVAPRGGYMVGLIGGLLMLPVVILVMLRWATESGSVWLGSASS
jgi:hypothetical protein